MGNEKSRVSKHSGTLVKPSSLLPTATASQQVNIQRISNKLLVWLDSNIDSSDSDCQNTIMLLRCVASHVRTFTTDDQCVRFVESSSDKKICIVVSGSLGQHTVPRVHPLPQVKTIFIFCGNKQYHEGWAKEWRKIKGVYTEIECICDALKQVTNENDPNALGITFLDTHVDTSEKKLDQVNPSFTYTQILKEILLTIEFEPQHFQAFVEHCREQFVDNEAQLKNIMEFERKYRNETAIWWFTCECFLKSMLHRALRTMDVDLIMRMGFFIGDLHRQIEQLHVRQFVHALSDEIFKVYRGQCLSTLEFNQLRETKDGLMSFNNFLLTTKNRGVSLSFARRAVQDHDLVGVVFVITVDPEQSTTPFASITEVSSSAAADDEVLFTMHTIFRVRNIKAIDESQRLFQVDLTLTAMTDKDVLELTDSIQKESVPGSNGWERLGSLLLKTVQSDKAQHVYEILLKQTTDESKKASIYNNLGMIKRQQGEYDEAIQFYNKSLAIYQTICSRNDPHLGKTYNNIGSVHSVTGDYSKALEAYEKALSIQQQSLPPTHPDLGASYNNIGNVYDIMGDHSKALASFEKAFAIRQQSLSPNHLDLADSYHNIGIVHQNMGDYANALSFYEKALAIQKESLPSHHLHLGSSYNNIGSMCENIGDYTKAQLFYEQAVENAQYSLPSDHPTLLARQANLNQLDRESSETEGDSLLLRLNSTRMRTSSEEILILFLRTMVDVGGRSSIEDDFMYGSNVASCHVYIRMQFLRKVYGIVATQLCFVALVSTIMLSLDNVKMFFQNNPGFLLLIFLATMVSLFAVYLKRLEYPTNFYLLGIFTFFESLSIGTLVSFFDKILVIQAIILTAVIVVGLTMYTFQTKRDFSAMGAGLYVFLCVLIAGGFLQIFLRSPIMELGLALGGAMVFSLYLVYDTQQIMRKTSPEEYIDAAIQIYLDITRLFIEILRILEAMRRD